MRFATLGSSGASISTLSLGTMTFGRESTAEESWAVLDAYVEAGGNVIDTADGYSAGASEEIVGAWLARASPSLRNDLVVATKARFPTGPGPNSLGLSRKYLSVALDASLKRLGVETVDLYQLHAWDPRTPIEETLRFLTEAVSAGKIHYVGISNFTGWQLQSAVDRAEFLGLVRPVSLQPQYNLLAREIEWEILPAAIANGMAVLPWSPLAGGWLTGKYSRDAAPDSTTRLGSTPAAAMNGFGRRSGEERTWQVIDAVRAIAEARGSTMPRVALAWLASRPGVTSIVLGARTATHLGDNLGALELELAPEERAALDAASDPEITDYPYGELGIEQRSRKLSGGR